MSHRSLAQQLLFQLLGLKSNLSDYVQNRNKDFQDLGTYQLLANSLGELVWSLTMNFDILEVLELIVWRNDEYNLALLY